MRTQQTYLLHHPLWLESGILFTSKPSFDKMIYQTPLFNAVCESELALQIQ